MEVAALKMVKSDNLKKRVLIAEDTEYFGKYLKRILEHHDYAVSLADNGINTVYKALYYLPDAILLDLMMPELDGVAVLNVIRKMQSTRNLPVLVVSATAEPKIIYQVMEMGANDFLRKPVDQDKLVERITTLIREHPQNNTAYRDSEEATRIDLKVNPRDMERFFSYLQKMFSELIKLIHLQEKNNLRELLLRLVKESEKLRLPSVKRTLQEMLQMLPAGNWTGILQSLEKIFFLFLSLRIQFNNSLEKEEGASPAP